MKRCAFIFENNEWRLISGLTIGDVALLRRRGAIILHQTIRRYGDEIHKNWVSDSGKVVVRRIETLEKKP